MAKALISANKENTALKSKIEEQYKVSSDSKYKLSKWGYS